MILVHRMRNFAALKTTRYCHRSVTGLRRHWIEDVGFEAVALVFLDVDSSSPTNSLLFVGISINGVTPCPPAPPPVTNANFQCNRVALSQSSKWDYFLVVRVLVLLSLSFFYSKAIQCNLSIVAYHD